MAKVRGKAKPKPARLIGYVRVSTLMQVEDGVSLDAQRERLAAYCAAHGAKLVSIESDNGVSGKIKPRKRPGLSHALERIAEGGADGLIVLMLSRLGRSTRDVLELADEFDRKHWRLISVSESLDTASAMGRFTLTILAGLAQLEREQISERTALALAHVARQGRSRSRFCPFGYRTADGDTETRRGDHRELVQDPTEQRLLRRILRLRKRGKGAVRIAQDLNRRRDLNPRTSREWTPQLVQRLLYTVERRQRALTA